MERRRTGKSGKSLRPDTTVEPVGEEHREVYIRAMPECCLRSFREEVVRGERESRDLSMECEECGRRWRVTSSLDERVLERFVTHAGPRVGGHPAA